MLEQIHGDPRGALHDSRLGVFADAIAQPRRLPDLEPLAPVGPLGQQIHDSVHERQGRPPIFQTPYRDLVRLRRRGTQPRGFRAREMELDRHLRRAAGGIRDLGARRMDALVREGGPGGMRRPRLADAAALWRSHGCAGGRDRRLRQSRPGGQIQPLEMFRVGNGTRIALDPNGIGALWGYLYFHANDREGGFKVNRGSLRVTVRRVK